MAHSSIDGTSDRTSRSQTWLRNLRHRLDRPPTVEVEDSWLLRVLVQSMVIVGILATDIAADIQTSPWAVPLAVLGGYWSWSHRRKSNVLTKFCIAIGMLLALASFFMNLRESFYDTRTILAILLIQLQTLHSFHMPRRQDLGYSMMIGLILIGVASTLSQTMLFGGLLLIFLTVSLPVLVLDYRSRLQLPNQQDRRSLLHTAGLSWKRLGGILLVILALGLSIFLVMPRFPGYQLRAFPVSAQINQDFQNNQQIINPGYVRQGNLGQGNATGATQANPTGPGEMDEEFYSGFTNPMNQNLRGILKPRLVMRVRSQVAGFWRVMAFDRYLGQGWEISRNDKTDTIKRPFWSYQFYLPVPVTLNQSREVVQTYTVVSDLPNVVPAMSYPRELFFPTPEVALDIEGGVRSPIGLPSGLTYTVLSQVPYRDRTRLREASTQYSDTLRRIYLDVPPAIRDRVRAEAETLLATSEQPITSAYEKSLFLAQALKQRYTVLPEMPYLNPNEDLVEAFLFKYKGGYPDHFSTTLTIMLRSLGIPARLVAGYASGKFNPFTGLYEVSNTDAYAMTEVYFPKFGWFAFDPIPGHELLPPSIEEDRTFSALDSFWKWIAGWLPSPVSNFLTTWFGRLVGWIVGLLTWLSTLMQQGWVGALSVLLGMVGLAFAGWLLWQGWCKWRYQQWLASLPPMESLYRQMLDWTATQGQSKQLSQTPYEYVQQAWTAFSPQRAAIIEQISNAYVQWRYGQRSPDISTMKQLIKTLQTRSQQDDSA